MGAKYNWDRVRSFIAARRKAEHPNDNPTWLYLVDPAKQRVQVILLKTGQSRKTLRCGTGRRGLGFANAQPPPGIFTMGGVRVCQRHQLGDPIYILNRS